MWGWMLLSTWLLASVALAKPGGCGGCPERSEQQPTSLPRDLKVLFDWAIDQSAFTGYTGKCRKDMTLQGYTTQVVQGSQYEFTLKFEHHPNNPSHCNPPQFGYTEVCTMTVWEKTWENFKEVTKTTCSKPELTDEELDAQTKKEVKGFFDWAVGQSQFTGSIPRRCKKTPKLLDYTTQVVAGSLYNFNVQFEHQPNNPRDCNGPFGGNTENCSIKVWSKPWEDNFKQITETTCSEPERRGCPGCPY